MTYHKSNNHNRWQQAIKSLQKIEGLPSDIFRNEKSFRQFATTGQIDRDSSTISINELTNEQINELWDFANHYFELDLLGFDALNEMVRDI